MSSRSFAACVVFVGALGCKVAAGEPPVVPVAQPAMRMVTDFAEFTGRTASTQSVEVRARVTGYLNAAPFKEGAQVKAGDLLFEIDPRPYQTQHEQARAQVELSKATLKLAQVSYKRDLDISRTPGAISQQQLDQGRAAVEEAEVRLRASQSALEVHKVNLDFTKVRAPIDGRISRSQVTPGNLVTQDQTVLTTIVSLDPIYVYFDMDERTLLNIYRAINGGKLKEPAAASSAVAMGLIGEEGYPHVGKIDFIDNQVDPKTGTIVVRGTFPNPRPASGVALMLPGLFARIRLPVGAPYQALLVPSSAIIRSNHEDFLLVVNAKDALERRPVQLGPHQAGGMHVIRAGITADDQIVLDVTKDLKAGIAVRPKNAPLPKE
jgi:membrane fusion protein, multidrug efflux system